MDSNKFVEGNGYASLEDWKTKKPDEYEKMEKVYFTYEDWINGNLNWRGWDSESGEASLYYREEGCSKLHVIPKEEQYKVIAKQKEILESHIKYRLENYLLNPFEKKLTQSLEPEQLTRLKLQEIEKILAGGVGSISMAMPGSRVARFKHEINELYTKVIVKADYEPRTFINATHENDFTKDLPIADTLAFYRFKKYLETLLEAKSTKGALDRGERPILQSENELQSTPQIFEELFHNPNDLELTFNAMRKLAIINDANQWIYGRKTGAIAAVIDVLKKRNKIKILPDATLAKLLAEKVGTSIGERTTRDTPKYFQELIKDLKVLIG
jgi:hypothetical protein